MKRFYRYIIYKLYSWALKNRVDTPVASVIYTLSFVHYIQLSTLYAIALRFFPSIDIFDIVDEPSVVIVVFLLAFSALHYLLLYNKDRWESYIEEFKNESPKERRQGTFLVLAYLIGSIIIFFAMMPVLFGI